MAKTMAKPRLKVERIARGYNVMEFSKLIGYSFAGYNKVELGRNGMRPKGVHNILKVLELEFEDLFEIVYKTEENARV
jgi:transcriptional regulator with XRE-family HTH domain